MEFRKYECLDCGVQDRDIKHCPRCLGPMTPVEVLELRKLVENLEEEVGQLRAACKMFKVAAERKAEK